MPTITRGATTITPSLILGYSAETYSRNVIHEILGRPDPDVSLRDDTLRSGTLRLLFEFEADAIEALELHATAGTLTLSYPEISSTDMTYVRRDRMTLSLDLATLTYWVLEVGFQEVTA